MARFSAGHHTRVREDIERVEDQIPAIGLDHRAGAHQGEIGRVGSEMGPPLDAAEKVVEVRVRLIDDRGEFECRIVDDDVYFIDPEGIFLFRGAHKKHSVAAGLLGGMELLEVAQDVLLNPVQVGERLFAVGVFFPQIVDGNLNDVPGNVLVQVPDAVPRFFFECTRFFHKIGNRRSERRAALIVFLALLLGKLLEGLRRRALPADQRDHVHPRLGHLDRETGLLRFLLKLFELFALALVCLLDDRLAGLVVGVGLEGLGDRIFELGDEGLHLLAEGSPLARRERKPDGAVRLLEIVDEDDRAGHGDAARQALAEGSAYGVLARPRRPRDVEVELVRAHPSGRTPSARSARSCPMKVSTESFSPSVGRVSEESNFHRSESGGSGSGNAVISAPCASWADAAGPDAEGTYFIPPSLEAGLSPYFISLR